MSATSLGAVNAFAAGANFAPLAIAPGTVPAFNALQPCTPGYVLVNERGAPPRLTALPGRDAAVLPARFAAIVASNSGAQALRGPGADFPFPGAQALRRPGAVFGAQVFTLPHISPLLPLPMLMSARAEDTATGLTGTSPTDRPGESGGPGAPSGPTGPRDGGSLVNEAAALVARILPAPIDTSKTPSDVAALDMAIGDIGPVDMRGMFAQTAANWSTLGALLERRALLGNAAERKPLADAAARYANAAARHGTGPSAIDAHLRSANALLKAAIQEPDQRAVGEPPDAELHLMALAHLENAARLMGNTDQRKDTVGAAMGMLRQLFTTRLGTEVIGRLTYQTARAGHTDTVLNVHIGDDGDLRFAINPDDPDNVGGTNFHSTNGLWDKIPEGRMRGPREMLVDGIATRVILEGSLLKIGDPALVVQRPTDDPGRIDVDIKRQPVVRDVQDFHLTTGPDGSIAVRSGVSRDTRDVSITEFTSPSGVRWVAGQGFYDFGKTLSPEEQPARVGDNSVALSMTGGTVTIRMTNRAPE